MRDKRLSKNPTPPRRMTLQRLQRARLVERGIIPGGWMHRQILRLIRANAKEVSA